MVCVALGAVFTSCEAGWISPIEIDGGWLFVEGTSDSTDNYIAVIMKAAPMTSDDGESVMVSFYMKPAWEIGQQIWLQVSGSGLVGKRFPPPEQMVVGIDRGVAFKSPVKETTRGGFISLLSDEDMIRLIAECARGTVMKIRMYDSQGVAWQWELELAGARTAIRRLAARPGCALFSSGLHSW